MSFIYFQDNIFSVDKCNQLIEEFIPHTKKNFYKPGQYYFHDFSFEKIQNEIDLLVKAYRKLYPTVDFTYDRWECSMPRFKHYPPNHAFSTWHCDHGLDHPLRIAAIIIYLSNHTQGTEFLIQGNHIVSKIGRGLIFPTAYTHVHQGHACAEKKDRYIISTYLTLVPHAG
jgi:hypothetical protein